MVAWLAALISYYVSLIEMRFSKCVWTCLLVALPLCLILLLCDELRFLWKWIWVCCQSKRRFLSLHGTWKMLPFAACKHFVSPQCFKASFLVLLKLFAKHCPGGTHILNAFICTHIHTHTHNVTLSPQLSHWSYKYGKAMNVCFPRQQSVCHFGFACCTVQFYLSESRTT